MHVRLLVPLLAAAIASGQTINTFAGNGTAGYTGDGGPAKQAEIDRVVGLAIDQTGNIYLADQLNNVIRKVDTNGMITTFAGTGTAGFGGDGGQAAQALLSGPLGVCVAPSGAIYVNDYGNLRVREISTTGIITTVAGNGSEGNSGDGGLATAATFTIPIRCAVDSGGNLYIVDQAAFRVRKVDSGGIITAYAGTGAQGFSGDGGPATQATFNNPTWVTVDASGNLYVTDQFNFRIRVVNAASGIITTVAGNGTNTFAGDGGQATSASLGYPGGTVLDSAGNLFIVDGSNNRIREVTGGIINTIAGTGTAGFTGDGGPPLQAELDSPFPITLDNAGNLYVGDGVFNGDTTDNRIREISGVAAPLGPVITSVLSGASFLPGTVPNSWVAIFGTNLATANGFWNIVNGVIPQNVDGVTVSIGGQPAYMEYVSSTQINVLAPDIGAGPVQVTVTNSLGTSPAFSSTSAIYGPAFFQWPNNYAVATYQDFSYAVKNGEFPSVTTVPAKPGDVLILWGTGFGPTTPAAPVGDLTPSNGTTYLTSDPVTVTVGGISATVYGTALAPGYAGLYQVAIQVPAVPNGDQPVVAKIGGVSSPITTLLTVQQ
ncbi:MAG: IPT/TIG domain-containing protein [Bryobacteraceae bacterium]